MAALPSGCGIWCDLCELWVPLEYACLTGCKRCFCRLHSSNFPERQMKRCPLTQELLPMPPLKLK